MTNSNDPEEIRREIERTRRDLSRNVDALTDQVAPSNMARREVNKVGESIRGLKDRVMGSHDDDRTYGYATTEPSRVDQVRDEAGQRLADAQGAVQGAPAAARRQTQGNPLGAGLIAFGIGAVIGGLMPSSRQERELATSVKDKAQPLVEEAKSVAQDAASNLAPQAQESVESLKQHVTESAQTVKGEGQDAAEAVKASAQDSAQYVKESAQDSASNVKGSAQDAKDSVQAQRNL